MPYSIGLDYGTNSVRALVVDTVNGREIGTAVVDYPSGKAGILLDSRDHHLARQHPGDYLFGLQKSVRAALAQAAASTPGFSPDAVIGIGVDATGSSPIPVTAHNIPLALHAPWQDHLAAQCWLWKDHTAHREAARITELAARHRPHYLAKCGNTYSSEWFWSKIWRCLKVAPEVFDAAFSWVELTDYIPATLAGVNEPFALVPGICCAGHKAMYSDEWSGLPDKEFLAMLDPKLADLRDRLYEKAYDATHAAAISAARWRRSLVCLKASRWLSARWTCTMGPSVREWKRARSSRSSARAPATARSSPPTNPWPIFPASAGSSKARFCPVTTASRQGNRRWATFSNGGSKAFVRATRRCTRR